MSCFNTLFKPFCNNGSVALIAGITRSDHLGPIAANKFVELTLSDKPQWQSLSRAELVFADFSISMEGRIKSAALLSIVRILEESC